MLSARASLAQYGHWVFPHAAFNSSSVKTTSIGGNGFVRAGYKLNTSPGTPNFYIEKSDAAGMITGAGSFSKEYAILYDSACTFPFAYLGQCRGLSVIETSVNSNPPARYAVAGGFNKGVFFSLLDAGGEEIMTRSWLFNSQPIASGGAKICESLSSPNNYYLCGFCDSSLYVIKVNSLGNTLWTSFYHSNILSPYCIMECPFTGEVLVSGGTNVPLSYNKNTDGFILKLNSANGNVLSYRTYGNYGCQNFYSMLATTAGTAGNAYVLGGESDPLTTAGNLWAVKISTSGNVLWSRIIQPTLATTATPFRGIVERPLQPSGAEYYALTSHPAFGLITIKLNENGIPSGGNNQFMHLRGPSNAPFATAITFSNAGPQAGLQLHALNSSNNNDFYLVKTDFSGQSVCNHTLSSVAAFENGSDTVTVPWIQKYGSLSPCNGISIKSTTVPSQPVDVCATVDTENMLARDLSIAMFPNPANEFIQLSFRQDEDVAISIYDTNGKLILNQKLSPDERGIIETRLDIRSHDFYSGCYYLKLEYGERKYCRKFIIQK